MIVLEPHAVSQVHLNVLRYVRYCYVILQPFHGRQEVLQKSEQPVNISNKAYSEYKHVLANISRSRYVAVTTQPVHRLQIRPTVHN